LSPTDFYRPHPAVIAAAITLVAIGGYLGARAILDGAEPEPGGRADPPSASPTAQPTESPSPADLPPPQEFVDRFMTNRLASHTVDRFLSPQAASLYEEHAGGLWLYDESLVGGPGAVYEGFTVAGPKLVKGARPRSWIVTVRIPVRWVGDAPAGEITEVLTVGRGRTAQGRLKPLVVLDASLRGRDDEGLPLPVALARHDIVYAAKGHDYAELAELTGDMDNFSYSFGESGDPIGYWRDLEEEGHVPILGDILSLVLSTHFAIDKDIFVWPAAHAKDPSKWSEVDHKDLGELYPKKDIRRFERAGGYTGWRVGISRDGSWLYFVSGD
jgi:hypothetical protein